ncbi:hypothetical protein HDU92_001382 [Lobulomyces angularis]|nr:hypothetical protein HDU92_001382 [Lobulomyces angularis]
MSNKVSDSEKDTLDDSLSLDTQNFNLKTVYYLINDFQKIPNQKFIDNTPYPYFIDIRQHNSLIVIPFPLLKG